jgi:hypothetical protein
MARPETITAEILFEASGASREVELTTDWQGPVDARNGYLWGWWVPAAEAGLSPRRLGSVPTNKELDDARRVVEAYDRARGGGLAAITVDGKVIDYPIAAQKRTLLARGRALGIK